MLENGHFIYEVTTKLLSVQESPGIGQEWCQALARGVRGPPVRRRPEHGRCAPELSTCLFQAL